MSDERNPMNEFAKFQIELTASEGKAEDGTHLVRVVATVKGPGLPDEGNAFGMEELWDHKEATNYPDPSLYRDVLAVRAANVVVMTIGQFIPKTLGGGRVATSWGHPVMLVPVDKPA